MLNRRFKFTDLALRTLPYTDAQTFIWDAGAPTLGMRIGKKTKTFFVMRAKGKRLSLGHFPALSLTEARQRLVALQHARYLDPNAVEAPRASQAVEQFMELHAKTTRPASQREFRRVLYKHFLPSFEQVPLNLITTQDILGITDKLLDRPALACSTHTVLRTFFNWSLRRQFIDKSPMAALPPPKRPPSRDRVLSDTELTQILKAALKIQHTPYGMIVLILAFTGLRKTEAHTLAWSRIDNYTITIPKEITKNKVELQLPNNIRGYLLTVPKTGDRLFPKQIHWPHAKELFDEQCGVHDWVLHDLRRTLSTNLARWEICPPDVTEAILNHVGGSRSTISKVYDRASRLPQARRALTEYADRLQALIKSA